MVAGRGTPDQKPARLMAAGDPDTFQTLIDRLVDASVTALLGQIEAGADVIQIFDSWAGILNDRDFDRWSIEPAAQIVARIKAEAPHIRVIGFPKGAGYRTQRYINATKIDGISIDWTIPVAIAANQLQPVAAIQGNLDPLLLVNGGDALDAAVDEIVSALDSGPFIFNLGHGIVPETPITHVERLVKRVRGD